MEAAVGFQYWLTLEMSLMVYGLRGNDLSYNEFWKTQLKAKRNCPQSYSRNTYHTCIHKKSYALCNLIELQMIERATALRLVTLKKLCDFEY